jgi:predicted dehydrogenase
MRILVVGLGSMGRRRLRNLTALGGCELAGFELDAERGASVADEHGVPVFASYDEALAWGPEALVISTPPDHHTPYAIDAINRGLHWFTEASVVPGDLAELLDLAAGASTVCAPSCTMRFHPGVALMRERIARGTIGRPLAFTHHVGQYLPDWHPWEDYRTFYVSRRETGAAREIVPFELNWLSSLFGPITALAGMRAKLSSLEADIDDIYSGVFEFASGVQGTLVIEVISRPAIRRARIVGEEGTLVWDFAEKVVSEWRAETGEWEEFPDPPPVQGPGGEWVAENMYIEEMRGYLDAIRGERPWPLSVAEDHALLEALADLERSSDSIASATRSEAPDAGPR